MDNYNAEPLATYDIRCKLLKWAKEQSTIIIASRIEAQGYDYVDPHETFGETDNIFMYVDAELVCTTPIDLQTLKSVFINTSDIKPDSPEAELSQLPTDVPEIGEVELMKGSKSTGYYYAYFETPDSFVQVYPARIYFEPYGMCNKLKTENLLNDKYDLEGFNSIDIYRNWLSHDKQNSIPYFK